MGENPKRKQEDEEAKLSRRRKQALGAKIFTAYIFFFAAMMTASFLKLLPVFEFEINFSHFDAMTT